MRIAFTFRNMESSESIKNYASDKLSKLQKYLHSPLEANVTVSTERHLRCVDVSLSSGRESYNGREVSEDMFASIDVVLDKLRGQLTRNHGAHSSARRRAGSAQIAGATGTFGR
jgi:putative sigma-54 modulation protein